jgi:hypothetical protein
VVVSGSGWHAVPPPPAAAVAAAGTQAGPSVQFIEAVWVNPARTAELARQQQQQASSQTLD